MITPTQIWLAIEPVDMRWGIDQLSLCVQRTLATSPCNGSAYVFSNRHRTRLKAVCWDGNGVWLCQRRLHRGRFVWPTTSDAMWALSGEQWQWLTTGIDWQRVIASPPTQWQV